VADGHIGVSEAGAEGAASGDPATDRSDLTNPHFEQPTAQGSFSAEQREHVQRSAISRCPSGLCTSEQR